MIRPDDRQLAALANIALSEEGKIVLTLIRKQLEETKDQLVSLLAEPQILRAQGRAAAFKELAEALEQAPDLISKRNRRT